MAWWNKPKTRETLVLEELDEAQRSLLDAETQLDWVTTLVDYHYKRIARLKDKLEEVRSEAKVAPPLVPFPGMSHED